MNDIVPKNFTIATAFKGLAPNKSLSEGVSAGFTWIGYRAQKWTLRYQGQTHYFVREDDGSPSPYLDMVVLDANPNKSRVYYEGTYDEGSASPPDCASLSGDVPDPGVPSPQSKTCGACKWSQFGTAANGGRGQACQQHRRMAVLLMPYMTKGLLPKPLIEPVYFKVPPGSLKTLKIYSDALVHEGIPVEAVITRVTFNPKRQFEMVFTLHKALTNAEAPVIKELKNSSQIAQIIGTMPEITEMAVPDVPDDEEETPEGPVETGLLEAFGKVDAKEPPTGSGLQGGGDAVKRRGRPPGSPNKPKLVTQQPEAAEEEETPPAENAAPAPWTEADDALDESLDKLVPGLQNKIQGMLK